MSVKALLCGLWRGREREREILIQHIYLVLKPYWLGPIQWSKSNLFQIFSSKEPKTKQRNVLYVNPWSVPETNRFHVTCNVIYLALLEFLSAFVISSDHRLYIMMDKVSPLLPRCSGSQLAFVMYFSTEFCTVVNRGGAAVLYQQSKLLCRAKIYPSISSS